MPAPAAPAGGCAAAPEFCLAQINASASAATADAPASASNSLPARCGKPAAAAKPGALPRIVVIGTGGTIAGVGESRSNTGTYVPAVRPIAELIDELSCELADVASVEAVDPLRVASESVGWAELAAIRAVVAAQVARPAVAGVVVTSGTDTMEEVCYCEDYYYR